MKKNKMNLKSGLACILAIIQIGCATGCAKNDISEKEYSDSQTTVFALEQGARALSNRISLDLSSNDEILNKDLVKKIGITEELLKNSYIKENITKFNEYLHSYVNSYYMHNNLHYVVYDKVEGQKILAIMNEYDVILCSITKTSDYVFFNYCNPSSAYIDEPETLKFNYDMLLSEDNIVYSKGWYTDEETYCSVHTHIFTEDEIKKESKISYYSDDKLLLQSAFVNNGSNSYTFKIGSDYNYYVTFKITEKDYQILDDLLESLKESDEHLDILIYFQDALLNIIENYGQEEKCRDYLNVIKEHNQKQKLTLNSK